MIVPTASQGVFATLITQMESGRLLAGMQFHTLNHFSTILAGTPNGHMTAVTVRGLLESSPDKVDKVPSEIIAALRNSLPVLEQALESAPDATVEAFGKLQRILQLTGSGSGISQTMSVVDPAALDRARDVLRSPERTRITSPALRYLENMRNVSAVEARLPVFMLDGKIVHSNGWPALLTLFSEHFGSPVTRESLQSLFGLDQEDCRIRTVDIRHEAPNRLRIAGEIRHGNETGGYFGMSIPAIPERGLPWTAKVEAINVVKERLGIGSALLFRVALFLHEMGVHTMEANAMEGAGLFCVFNGFRVGKSLYEDVVAEFVEERARLKDPIPEALVRKRLLDRDANLAELATFEVDGRRIGREFLSTLFTRKYLPVKFELSADKQAWLRLLSNLHRNQPDVPIVPPEWQRLQTSTRQMLLSGAAFVGGNVLHLMASDSDHAIHLIERINNWATGVSMAMSFPAELYDRLPESTKRVTQANIDAIADALRMIARDPSSVLFSDFLDHMGTGANSALDLSTNRSFLIARTLMTASERGYLEVPRVFQRFFAELVTRE